MEKFWGYKTEVKERIEIREIAALKKTGEGEEHLDIYRRLRKETGMKTRFYGPMDYANTIELQLRVGDMGLSERRNKSISGREKEDAQMCPCGKANESRINIVWECEICKEERDMLEMRKIDERDMEKFNTLDNSGKTIAILGDRWRLQKAKQEAVK